MTEKKFIEFLSAIEVTSAQLQDAQTKYQNVCGCLDRYYYDSDYTEAHKYLFGSYKTKTHIRPIVPEQDVDVLFKIPQEIYDKFKENPGGMLQDVRKALKERFSTTEKISAWQKVVLVQFADGTHNVEVLPAIENDDKTFTIPDNQDGGTWVSFDPRSQVDAFAESNKKTQGLTRNLVRILKAWVRYTSTLSYKSYRVVEDAIAYLDNTYPNGKGSAEYDEIVQGFLKYHKSRMSSDDERYSHFETAIGRADKAVQYRKKGQHVDACNEWRKVFGDKFPKDTETEKERCTTYIETAPKPWAW